MRAGSGDRVAAAGLLEGCALTDTPSSAGCEACGAARAPGRDATLSDEYPKLVDTGDEPVLRDDQLAFGDLHVQVKRSNHTRQ